MGLVDVRTASDGEEALHIIRDSLAGGEPVNLILVDLRMPNMDGAEFLRFIKEEDHQAGIILTSALDSRILSAAESLARARELNILGALEKPLKVEELRHLLNKAHSRETRRKKLPPCSLRSHDLARAIQNAETFLYYQPQVSTENGSIKGIEVLARWKHPDLGFISPEFFVPLAEEEGLVSELTEKVLRVSLAQSADWIRSGCDHRIAVNISVDLLSDVLLPDRVEEIALQEGLSTESIILEITESRGIVHLADALEVLTRFRLKGFGLSIDDYGTGNSTLEQLRRFPFTELKIDQAYVTGAVNERSIHVMLESTISMARKLGLRVIAEGVETREELELVVRMECDEVQGFYFARPMPSQELMPWIREYRAHGPVMEERVLAS